jgi:hypothetical protein
VEEKAMNRLSWLLLAGGITTGALAVFLMVEPFLLGPLPQRPPTPFLPIVVVSRPLLPAELPREVLYPEKPYQPPPEPSHEPPRPAAVTQYPRVLVSPCGYVTSNGMVFFATREGCGGMVGTITGYAYTFIR